jgi:hypothetical protein
MAKDTKQRAVGDASDPRTTETDPNGAGTAVGVPHPENRPEGQSLPAVDLSGFELDDYDEDKQRPCIPRRHLHPWWIIRQTNRTGSTIGSRRWRPSVRNRVSREIV